MILQKPLYSKVIHEILSKKHVSMLIKQQMQILKIR